MTRVKICGITNLEDARRASELGTDELGFNFYSKSPRFVSPETAASIISGLPSSIFTVGVFVNESRNQILKIAATARLDAIQLHGDEDYSFVHDLFMNSGLMIIKAVRPRTFEEAADALDYDTHALLVDAFCEIEYGGTGLQANWERARDIWTFNPYVYLAGGLNPTNVAEAIKSVHPYAVDVASGVESSPGEKDAEKMRRFIEAVRNAG